MENIINSILGYDNGTRSRAVASIVTYTLDFLTVFKIISFNDEQRQAILQLVLMIVTGIVWLCSHYKNNCTSEINCKYTGLMRAEKQGFEDEGLMEFDESEEVTDND